MKNPSISISGLEFENLQGVWKNEFYRINFCFNWGPCPFELRILSILTAKKFNCWFCPFERQILSILTAKTLNYQFLSFHCVLGPL